MQEPHDEVEERAREVEQRKQGESSPTTPASAEKVSKEEEAGEPTEPAPTPQESKQSKNPNYQMDYDKIMKKAVQPSHL